MKFGMLHLFENPDDRTEHEIVSDQLDIIQAAEDVGFDSVWPAEHHFSEYGYCPSPALTLAALARVTKRVRLGTGVVVLPFHDPIRVAEEYAFLDLMCDGRLDFGVGRGYQPIEFKGHRVDQTKSRGIFRESLEIITQAWTQERVNYDGKFFQIDDLWVRPKPLQDPHPPIWMAAVSPETYALAGKFGANLMYAPVFTPEGDPMLERLEEYRGALRENGHDPATKSIAALRMIYVADSMEEARREFEAPVIWYYRTFGKYVTTPKGEPPIPGYENYGSTRDLAVDVNFQTLVDAGTVIAGTPDYVNEQIEKLEDDWGFTDLLCWTRLGGMETGQVMKSMELMERHVIPHFKEKEAAPVGAR